MTQRRFLKRDYWIPEISPQQEEIMKLKTKFNLITGPRLSSKTFGIEHALVQHAYHTEGARIAVVGRTQTDNADGGAWTDLVDIVLPEWIRDGIIEYVSPPKMDGATHKISCTISNKYGGGSLIQLDSLAIEDDVERRFKGKRYSAIYMTEASNFRNRFSFDVLQECLRMPHLRPDQHKMWLDTNPPPDGRKNWMYKLFYEFRLRDNFDDEPDEMKRLAMRELQEQLTVMEFTIDDNPYITAEQKRFQYAKYSHNRDLLDRFYYGKWIEAEEDSVFRSFFKPHIHVNLEGSDPQNPEVLIPEENCSKMGSGWDVGSANNAVAFIEDIQVPVKTTNDSGMEVEVPMVGFKILDEFVSLGTNIPIYATVEAALGSMEWIESMIATPIYWRHISDRSSFDRYDAIGDTAEYKEIYAESNGRIELERGPVKKRGSVQSRVNLMKKLLFQDRLFVSSKCVAVIEMLKNIRAGKHTAIDIRDPNKHVFDAVTYYISMVCWSEMEDMAILISGKKNDKPKSIISV